MYKSFTQFIISILYLLFILGCSSVSAPQKQANIPKAAYDIDYNADTHLLSIQSINVTPPHANVPPPSGDAGIFQIGPAIVAGNLITVVAYITNSDTNPWTGVEVQLYQLLSGNNVTVYNPDFGTGWPVDSPAYGAWGWLFTSGTAGSEFTIDSGASSVYTMNGFYADSNFTARVYIYANVPVISGINPVASLAGSTVTVSGYNFGTTQGSITFNGVAATVQNWADTSITAIVPANTTLGNVVVDTGDQNTPYSNPILFTPYSVLVNDQTFATIDYPIGITTDTSGNLYVADLSNNNIAEATPSGTYSVYSNDPNHVINGPFDVAFSPEGMLYVANSGGDNIIEVPGSADPAGVFADVGLTPVALAFSGEGQSWPMYVANSGDGTITSVTSSGTATQFASGFSSPYSIATDNAGNVYVGDCYTGDVYEINAAGTVTTTIVSGLVCPTGIKFDANGIMYIFDYSTLTLYKYNPNVIYGNKVSVFAQDVVGNGDYNFVFSPDFSLLYITQNYPVNGIITIPLQ